MFVGNSFVKRSVSCFSAVYSCVHGAFSSIRFTSPVAWDSKYVLIVFALFPARLILADTSDVDAQKVLRLVMEERGSLVTGECTVSGSVQTHLDKQPTKVDIRYFFDFSLPAFKVVSGTNGQFLRTQDFFFRTFEKSRSAPEIHRRNISEPPYSKPEAFDIRGVGLFFRPDSASATICVDFDVLQRRYLASTEQVLEKLDSGLLKLSFTDSVEGGHVSTRCHLWVDPAKGFVTTQFQVDLPSKPNEYVYRTEMEWAAHSGVWVVSKVAQRSGSSLPPYELIWNFVWTNVNSGVITKELTPNGLVPEGKEASVYVVPVEGDRPLQVDFLSNKEKEEVTEVGPPRPVRYSTLLLTLGVVLAIAGLLIYSRKHR